MVNRSHIDFQLLSKLKGKSVCILIFCTDRKEQQAEYVLQIHWRERKT